MSTTELDDVMALLERVLPDPVGFAERLFQQVVTQWAEGVESGDRTAGAPDLSTHFDPSKVVVVPSHEHGSHDTVADSNILLASALGACDCWGLQADCTVCKGAGSSGWTQPDVELFQEFVAPAVEKLSAASTEYDDEASSINQDQDDERDRTNQGVSA